MMPLASKITISSFESELRWLSFIVIASYFKSYLGGRDIYEESSVILLCGPLSDLEQLPVSWQLCVIVASSIPIHLNGITSLFVYL